MTAVQAYRYALDLTATQQRAVLAHAGAARVAHNWALARVAAVMQQRAAERSCGVPDDQLTRPVAGRGADQKTRARGQVAVKRQPGTAKARQTGTVPPQGRTIDRVLVKAHSSGNGWHW